MPMPCTAARRDATFLPLLLCSLGGWPRLALLDKQAGQALDGSSFAFALACRFIARRPARPGPHLLSPSERSSWGGSADDPSSIHLLEKKRKGPSVTDRSRPGHHQQTPSAPSQLATPSPASSPPPPGRSEGNASSLSQQPSPTVATSRPAASYIHLKFTALLHYHPHGSGSSPPPPPPPAAAAAAHRHRHRNHGHRPSRWSW